MLGKINVKKNKSEKTKGKDDKKADKIKNKYFFMCPPFCELNYSF